MACSCSSFCETADQQFTKQKAVRELERYRRKGAGATTRALRDGLADAELIDGVLLDIGTGIGALAFELLDRGATHALAIDASQAYLASARAEAERRAMSDRVRFVHADFITAADGLPTASVVTLDRVVCCYPFHEPLLEHALRHAERAFAFSYPRDCWYVRAVVWIENAMRSRAHPFRTFVHPAARMEQIIHRAGFERVSRRVTFIWSADVFTRRPQ
jgi:tRNA1(Val) A37 N6-methylase TrmN6